MFDKFTDKDFSMLLNNEQEKYSAVNLILETCQKYLFDGIVLEVWSQLAARVADQHLIDFVREIGKKE